MNDSWLPTCIAEHEAMHAVAAMRMGLPVAYVTVEPGFEEGVHFPAAVHIPEELIDRERDCLAICVSMSAPSHLDTHRVMAPGLWRYAQLEADSAYEIAGRYGHTFGEVYDHAAIIVSDHLDEMAELAERLVAEGKVVFAAA